jgi:hypothetical protein
MRRTSRAIGTRLERNGTGASVLYQSLSRRQGRIGRIVVPVTALPSQEDFSVCPLLTLPASSALLAAACSSKRRKNVVIPYFELVPGLD